MSSKIIRLTWSLTGDYFEVEPTDAIFCQWFVDQCNQLGNEFTTIDNKSLVDNQIIELKNNIIEVNEFLKQINFPEILVHDDFCNQSNLNYAHRSWITVLRKDSRIDQLMYFKDPELFKKFMDINSLIHDIEKKFKYRINEKRNWRLSNPFEHTILEPGIYNVCLAYTDWGKSSWHKFVDGDHAPNDHELSNWKTVGSNVVIDLCRPYKSAFAPEYLKYCTQHQIEPTVEFWPIGNLVDPENTMPLARKIMNKNIQIENNSLQFSIAQ